jgi:hypothetical protein
MKALAITAMAAGAAAFLYGLAGWLDGRSDPLADLLLLGIALPALAPIVLGAFLARGRRWALYGLRTIVLLMLAGGAWLTWGLGLGVFSFPPFAVPFVGACLLWLVSSYVLDRGGEGAVGARRAPGSASGNAR